MTSAMLANFVQAGWGALPSVRPPRDRERARAPFLPPSLNLPVEFGFGGFGNRKPETREILS